MVYIDGYNVSRSLKSKYGKRYYWLNYRALAEQYLKEDEAIVGIRYFTAVYPGDAQWEAKHKIYMQALTQYAGINPIMWDFQLVYRTITDKNPRERITPPNFQATMNTYLGPQGRNHFSIQYKTYEEKKSDVNMALAIYRDAAKNKYEKAILITWDNDIAPAVKLVRGDYPQKEFMVLFPPGGKGHALKKICQIKQIIQEQQLRIAQLPNPVMVKDPQNPTQWIALDRPTDWQ